MYLVCDELFKLHNLIELCRLIFLISKVELDFQLVNTQCAICFMILIITMFIENSSAENVFSTP